MSLKSLSSDELAKILKEGVGEEDKDISSLSLHYTVKKFINDYEIANGALLVPNYAMYYIYRYEYDTWNPLDYWTFCRQFKTVFPTVRRAKTRYFKVSEDFPYKYKKDKKYKLKIEGLICGRKEAKQKKQSKISSLKEGLQP